MLALDLWWTSLSLASADSDPLLPSTHLPFSLSILSPQALPWTPPVEKCVWGASIGWGTVCIDVGGGKESYSSLSLNTSTTDIVAIVLHFGTLWPALDWC
jgi:hypothetical protein